MVTVRAVLCEGGNSPAGVPANFRECDAGLFGSPREIPPTRLLEYTSVRATPEGVLLEGRRFLQESFAYPDLSREFLANRRSVLKFAAKNFLLRRRRRVRECLWITDTWSAGYYHWLADALPRLYAAREVARHTPVLLPDCYAKLDFVSSSLCYFRERQVEYVGRNEVCLCDKLLMPTHTAPSGWYNPVLLAELRDYMLNATGAEGGESRLYVSRARAAVRRVANEAEILPVLEEFGFRTVYLEDYPFDEQVRLTASARYLVSSHGAGLTNIMFMRPGCRVLELRRNNEKERNWFLNLASVVRLNYYYQLCSPADPGSDAHSGDLVAEPMSLRTTLRLMLSE